DAHLPVEAAGPQQSRIEHVGPVRGRNHDHVRLRIETGHFDEQLVERLFAFIVAAAHALPTALTDGIDLIHENDGGRVCLRLFEQVTHATRSHADEHLDEVGT